ncbi:MAG: AAA family ATPase [Candidatus Aenigmatarchaeota archaeon]
MRKIIAIVGMPGAGKSEATRMLGERGYSAIRFGAIVTEDYLRNKGKDVNEKNERNVRERLRKKYGMAAMAKLSAGKISEALKKSNVAIDGMYSWEEYLFLKRKYGKMFFVVAVYASPKTRQKRLGKRKIRPLTPRECASRDYAQIEKLKTGGPIASADFTIVNEGMLGDLKKSVSAVIRKISKF